MTSQHHILFRWIGAFYAFAAATGIIILGSGMAFELSFSANSLTAGRLGLWALGFTFAALSFFSGTLVWQGSLRGARLLFLISIFSVPILKGPITWLVTLGLNFGPLLTVEGYELFFQPLYSIKIGHETGLQGVGINLVAVAMAVTITAVCRTSGKPLFAFRRS